MKGASSLIALAVSAAAASVGAQEPAAKIKDNSFLIEEAYNQEAGVVQHISTFSRATAGGGWNFSFTQEWPVTGMRHQFSYSVPVTNDASGTGVGDLALNYRFQLAGLTGGRFAAAPRLSLITSTGDEAKGRGAGSFGLQSNLPLSYEFGDRVAGHGNAGLTYTPKARDAVGNTGSTASYAVGGSLIWLVSPTVNLMLESVWSSNEVVAGASTSRSTSYVVAPGFRTAFNLAGGMQIVPGLAYVMNPAGSGDDSIFLYFSIEHPFKR